MEAVGESQRHEEGKVGVRDAGAGGRDDCGWVDRVKQVNEK